MLKKLISKITGKPVADYDIMSFKDGFRLTGQPIVIFNQGGKSFNFMLDSGSTDCIVDKGALKSIKHKLINQKTTLTGMDGIQHIVPWCMITLEFNNKDYEFAYLVQDLKPILKNIKESTGVTIHGFLGSKFFNYYKYVLDFDELIAYSKR